MPGPDVVNSYSGGGALRSTLPLRGIDIGPAPDFYAELRKLASTLKPRSATTQAGSYAAPASGGSMARPISYSPAVESRAGSGVVRPVDTGQDLFYQPQGLGINSSGLAYKAWSPGMPISAAQAPIYGGNWDVSNMVNAMPQNAGIELSAAEQERVAAAGRTGETEAERRAKDLERRQAAARAAGTTVPVS